MTACQNERMGVICLTDEQRVMVGISWGYPTACLDTKITFKYYLNTCYFAFELYSMVTLTFLSAMD